MANHGNPQIAAVIYQTGFVIDDFLNEVAGRLRADAVRLGGAVQENLRSAADEACAAMVLTEPDRSGGSGFPRSWERKQKAAGSMLPALPK